MKNEEALFIYSARILAIKPIVVIIILLTTTPSIADTLFIETADRYLNSVSDLSDKQSFVMDAINSKPNYCTILYDFSEGNRTIVSIDGDKCKVYAQFERDEMLGILYHMLSVFGEIDGKLPSDNELEYRIRLADDCRINLHADNIAAYFFD